MQIYKLFIKLLIKHKKELYTYIGIFIAIILLMFGQYKQNQTQEYANIECTLVVYDYDESSVSQKLKEYLDENNDLVSIKKDDKEVIQDELYFRNIDCVVRIKEGFEEALMSGNDSVANYLEIEGITGSNVINTCKNQVNQYIKIMKGYLVSGKSLQDACKLTKDTLSMSGTIILLETDQSAKDSKTYSFFLLCCYCFLGMSISGIGLILIIIRKKDVQKRIQCSSYKFYQSNKEIFLGVLTAGCIFSIFFIVLAIILCGKELFTMKGGLFIINMLIIMIVSLTLTFLISKLTNNSKSLEMVSQIVSLGSCFLTGIFVPLEYLGKDVLKIARFLPTYWYCLGCEKIENYGSSANLSQILSCYGMELLFAVAFLAVSMAVARVQYQKNIG